VPRLHAAAKNGETGFERGDLVCSAEPCGSFLEPTQDLGGFAERIERRSRVLDDIRSEPDMMADRKCRPGKARSWPPGDVGQAWSDLPCVRRFGHRRNAMLGTFAGAWIIIVLVGLVIAALWIALPFAVFGIKPLIRQLIEEQRETRIAIVANTRASEASIARVAANPIVAAQPVVGGS